MTLKIREIIKIEMKPYKKLILKYKTVISRLL